MAELTVLVVEDEPLVAAAHRDYVGRVPGFVVVGVAGTVHEAVRALARQPIDLVLLDVNLPDGSGLEVLDFMRGQPRLAEVPALVVSAAADQDLLAEARARGAQACLLKPVDLQQLRQMALSLLGEVV